MLRKVLAGELSACCAIAPGDRAGCDSNFQGKMPEVMNLVMYKGHYRFNQHLHESSMGVYCVGMGGLVKGIRQAACTEVS